MTKKMLKKLIFNYNIKYFFKSSHVHPIFSSYWQGRANQALQDVNQPNKRIYSLA